MIHREDAAILLIDHQSGLFQAVVDIDVAALRANAAALARLATLENLPVIVTASMPEGPNGPLMPEIRQRAPHAVFVPRKGEVNAWNNPDFVRAVENTGKKTLLIAGVLTSVCVALPALSARAEGYTVLAVMDASGDMSVLSSQTTLARLAQAGVDPISTLAVIADLQQTWNRPEVLEYAQLYAEVMPRYRTLLELHASTATPPRP